MNLLRFELLDSYFLRIPLRIRIFRVPFNDYFYYFLVRFSATSGQSISIYFSLKLVTSFIFLCAEFIQNLCYLMSWFRFTNKAIFAFHLKVGEKSVAISCRAVWSKNDHNEVQLIVKQDTCWKSIFGKFLETSFSHRVTGTTTNTKTSSNTAQPGIAYFIVFRKNLKANETVLFSCLHDTGMNASVTRISSNKK